jgi:cytochrome c556
MFQGKRKALRLACIAGVLLGATAGLALAAGESAETIIKARQTHLKDMGAAFKTVRDQTRKPEPEMVQVKEAAAVIAKAAAAIDTWFPKGSGPDSKFETDAKAEIWADPQGFATAAKALKAEAPKLQQLANANDVAGVKGQVGKLGGACKGCHDKYRVPQD